MKACVIIPTYNERGNVSQLIESLLRVFDSIKDYEMHILVVDDNSPDGTADVVQSYCQQYSNISLIKGNKEGLGSAYLRGFKWALDKFDIVFEMDADLSHDPERVPQLLSGIEHGFDVVIGSRYVKGGSTPDWNLARKLISRGGNFFARIVGGLYKVHDCTSGFRAIRTDVLRNINFDYLATRGYAFQITLLYELYMAGARIKEIPIVFKDREYGESKLTKKDIIEFLLNSHRLRLRTGERFAKFATVGFVGTILNTFLLWLLTEVFSLYYLVSSAIAIELAILFNFVFNDLYTFRDKLDNNHYFSRMLKFNGIALYSFVINLAVLYLLTAHTGLNYLVSNLIGIFTATAWNYLVVLDYIWRTKSRVYYAKKAIIAPVETKASS